MYEYVTAMGTRFTFVGVVTLAPTRVESVLAWANQLQDHVEYVVAENVSSSLADFTCRRSTEQANCFRKEFTQEILQMEFRPAELETLPGNIESDWDRSRPQDRRR